MPVKLKFWDERTATKFAGFVPKKGIDGFLGITIDSFEPGQLVASFEVLPDMVTMIGNVHGGCISAFCDHVLGVVLYPAMPKGSWAATTEFKINLLRPVSEGVCTASAEVIAMSKSTAVVRIDVTNKERLVAAAQGTCLIMGPQS